ncbi:hypothetical protein NE683_14090 [Bariatricus massiliensis]|uniref:Uncharacterized protein n=1 Tax=Bariatricus massiliensis TaxID=1745713 RepID=A0ABS8DLR9_9FIRM|nr:hypothetical protein [Bariatricus massiliensis]MCB7306113.1 hypothetical protein [Bariatricus massiliensis]MCB7376678.1 hypothetical protein [Bariatricus massiliensis]MCB7389336.1 hypothetical protein [Bariatricus massiliensis]MCB7413477.1 hypothetical protein [Bariatricus massiliensis]MCQ5254352.1 hypothetical protein [Bariatricus massiliensis]
MDFIEILFMSKWFTRINLLIGTILTIALLMYAFSKEGKDERGRGIIGTSCLWGIVALFVILNIIGALLNILVKNVMLIGNAIQSTFTLIILIIDILILILRKIR